MEVIRGRRIGELSVEELKAEIKKKGMAPILVAKANTSEEVEKLIKAMGAYIKEAAEGEAEKEEIKKLVSELEIMRFLQALKE